MLEDGTIFKGVSAGLSGTVRGEVVFNTAMSGYEEVLTDPSYAGQIVVMTAPMIGNTGINFRDSESGRIHLSGFVTAEMCFTPSHHRSKQSLPSYLSSQNTVAATGIDTRSLTIHLRRSGVQRGILTTEVEDHEKLLRWAKEVPSIESQDLVSHVTGSVVPERLQRGSGGIHVVVFDFGAKGSIIQQLEAAGAHVQVVPSETKAQSVLESLPDGVVLSNGPGDPSRLTGIVSEIRGLLGRVPILGICLGHQLLCLASGAKTYKLPFGHHGVNHPVVDLRTRRVWITSQNHNYAVDENTLPEGCSVWFRSLYDGSLEGVRFLNAPILSVQFHPEAAPGPTDAHPVFEEFIEILSRGSRGA
ncbi:MAG: glutamine-hydrolyzing carbamoyl-phosphate synthase small subunit [Leptospirales bacterium]